MREGRRIDQLLAEGIFEGRTGIFIVIGLIGLSLILSIFTARQRGESFFGSIMYVIFPFLASAVGVGGVFLITVAGWMLPDWTRIAGIVALLVGVGMLILYIRRRR